MYRFLDRPLEALDQHHRFLIGAMRHWTRAARSGRCGCRALAEAFHRAQAGEALPHFGIAMLTLDREGAALLRFGAVGADRVSDDEARVLALFERALDGDAGGARRIAATLVVEGTVAQLTTAIGLVAMHLMPTIMTEDDE